MKRRGFLGFMGGAVAAGPGMAKQAAAQTLASLSVGDAGLSGVPMYAGPPTPDAGYAAHRFAKFKAFIESADGLRRRRFGTGVHALDPDLAGMRSFSLGAKIRIQRDRNFERWLENESGWLQRAISGQDEDY